MYFDTKKRTLKPNAISTLFPYKETKRRKSPRKRNGYSGTDSASEEEPPSQDTAADATVQVSMPFTCTYQFSVNILRSAPVKQRLISFYRGFLSEDIL